MGEENGSGRKPAPALPPLAVSRAMLATAPGKRKLDLIFDSPDPRQFIRRLPAEDLYFAIREIGLDDAAQLVALASPGQFRTFVDLDAWSRDQLVPAGVLTWLRLAHAGGEREALREKRKSLDPEVVLLVLKGMTIVHSLEENDDPVLSSSNFLRTAEGKYIVEITDEGDEGLMARRVIEDFIDDNPFEATRHFEAVRWELATELEETALRWRTGRLRDLGFPELEEAVQIWRPLPSGWTPAEFASPTGPVAGVPAMLLASSRAPLFLDRAAALLPDEARPRFNEGLIYLLNCALVADGIEPKNADLARSTLSATRDLLSLGVELASDGDEDRAVAMLGTTPATELFRLAVTRVSELSRHAAAAARRVSPGAGSATNLDSPEAELLAGLKRKRPRLYEPPVAGARSNADGDFRALRDRADLARAAQVVERAEAIGELLEVLGVDAARFETLADAAGRAPAAVTIGQVVSTAMLRAARGVSPDLEPLAGAALVEACAVFENGRFTAEAASRLEAWAGTLGDRVSPARRGPLGEVFARWRARLEEELGRPAAAGSVDPRHVEAVLVCDIGS
jgi:hypothetical protein